MLDIGDRMGGAVCAGLVGRVENVGRSVTDNVCSMRNLREIILEAEVVFRQSESSLLRSKMLGKGKAETLYGL